MVGWFMDGRKKLIVPNEGLTLQTRGYAANMAHALLLAVEKPTESAGQIYNVGDERLLSLREWVVLIGRALNYEWELVSLPGKTARPARPYAGRDNHEVLDIGKVKMHLGYRDLISAEEGIARTVKYSHPIFGHISTVIIIPLDSINSRASVEYFLAIRQLNLFYRTNRNSR